MKSLSTFQVHDILESNDYSKINEMLDSGWPPSHVTEDEGRNLLHLFYSVTENYSVELASYLISRGVDPDAETREKMRPIHFLIRGLHLPEHAAMLISHGIDVNAIDGIEGWTPLRWAISINFKNLEIAKLLLDAGADPYLGDDNSAVEFSRRAKFTDVSDLFSGYLG